MERIRWLRELRSGSSPAAGSADLGRVSSYVRLNLLTLAVAVAWLITLRIWFVPSPWLVVIAVLLVALSGCLFRADALLRRGRYVAAIVAVAVFNWVAAITATALVPYALVILPITILLPTLLAVPHLNPVQLRAMLGATIAVELATGLVGRMQNGIGLEDQAPGWILHTLVILFVPITAGLAVFLAWQNHAVQSARADELVRSRLRLMTTTDRERRRIERDLNEGTHRRIIAAEAHVTSVKQLIAVDRAQAGVLLADIAGELQVASIELRVLTHGIYPPQLTEHGLEAALRTVGLHSPLPMTLLAIDVERYPPDIESAVYFCCIEASHHALRHAGSAATVTITLQGGDGLSFDVEDTGTGCDPVSICAGDGFTVMVDRIGAIGGALTVVAGTVEGVHLHGDIPQAVLAEPAAPNRRQRVTDATCSGLAIMWDVARRIVSGREPSGADSQIMAGLQAQLVPTFGTIVFILGAYALVRNVWLLLLTLVTAAAAVIFLVAKRAAQRDDLVRALAAPTISIWIYALIVVALVPVSLPPTSILIVVPIMLAIPYVRRHFQLVTIGTVVFAVAVALVGRLSTGVGIEQEAPGWLVDLEVILITLVNSTVLLSVVSMNHAVLTAKAGELQDSRKRVVADADRERRAIERNLHDGAQQRLVAAAIQAQCHVA